MTQKNLRYQDGKSDKFWTISLSGCSHTVTYGRSGTNGQTQTKEFPTVDAALKSYEKLIAEKLKKGYLEVDGECSDVIVSPVESVEQAIAIPQIVESAIAAKPLSVELNIEKSLDLDPEDWLLATWRSRTPKLRSEAKPFNLQNALKRLQRIEGAKRKSSGHFYLNWSKAEIAIDISPEEANFWLTAMTCDMPDGRPDVHWDKKNLADLVALLANMNFEDLPDRKQTIHNLLRTGRLSSPQIALPVNKLFPIVEIIVELYHLYQSSKENLVEYVSLVFSPDYIKQYARSYGWNRSLSIEQIAETLKYDARSLITNLISGFKLYIHPYLTDAEIQAMQEQLRPILKSPVDDLETCKLAAYLGMHEQVKEQVAIWQTWQANVPIASGVNTSTGYLNSREALEVIFGLSNAEAIESTVRRLNLAIAMPEHIRGWLANTEFNALDMACKSIQTDEQLQAFALAKAPEVAPYMLELWISLKRPQLARQWLEDYPSYAVVGLIPVVADTWVDPVRVKPNELKKAATAFLQSMKRKGYESLISAALERETPEIAAKVRSLIFEQDEPNYELFDDSTTPQWLSTGISELPKQKRAKPPTWVSYADLPLIVIGDRALNEEQINACLIALNLSTLDSPLELVKNLKTHANRQSLDTFIWALFERWLNEGAPNKEKWAMCALGLLGSDAIVLKLTPLIRIWPGESQHPRAVLGLECLRAIGTDTALMQIHGIAQKIKFQGLKARAQDCMEAIARDRQLTTDQLADRIIPDCGLDAKGQRTFDFGSRQFKFLLGADLKPMLRDPQGKKIATLPKPNSKDDLGLANSAIADWKLIKKQIGDVAKLHSLRLETAMVEYRTWNWQDFETLLVRHPLMTHLVQRTIWATYDAENRLQGTFRVAEDQTYTDANDNPYNPDLQLLVGIPHPLTLDDATKSLWGEVIGDYEIMQPFPQINRDIYFLTDEEREADEITRFADIPIPGVTLVRMIESRGWLKGGLHDHGDYCVNYKYFPQGDVTAIIGDYETLHVAQSDIWGDVTMKGCLFIKGECKQPYEYPKTGSWYAQNSKLTCLKLGEVDRIVISEVLRDMTAIASSAK
jgi:predicted DNA-binding WGR domain protein